MDNVFVQAGIISVLYLIMKFAEMRIVLKENKPIKLLMRDAIIVYISSIIGIYIIEEFLLQGTPAKNVAKAFVDNPNF